ncbi:ABC transporter ATP-binding protein [Solidesulfovibrio carbinolicus]|uniref:ABC transporter ATP-binding protein n=1 Tax=Solidesulfovibrio carbinolicus TaxID=296842 RepID=A0A4P6HNA3_9BACT|nr:ABC transporter ATP-binding protein [Solidesulfovibrio carbinolicus]QAZ68723.1 ABC transporter ATP-binding protein [Solidesulfovibrio carbinolicus]
MAAAKTLLAARGVAKTFRLGKVEVPALGGVDMTVGAGEVVLLMGPSGSGKTTLLSILGCILSPSAGSVAVLGRDTAGLPEAELAKVRLAHFGFIFQGYNLFPTLKAEENVRVALDLRGVQGADAVERSRQALDAVGLGDKFRMLPRDLSGGQKQRVAIARALVAEPDILLADEPTAALDSETGKAVIAILRELAVTHGRSVVIVTHDPRIAAFADRVIRIEDGRIVGQGQEVS